MEKEMEKAKDEKGKGMEEEAVGKSEHMHLFQLWTTQHDMASCRGRICKQLKGRLDRWSHHTDH